MPRHEEILVAGAGIGGLTTAISLHKAGFDVRVFEAAPEIRPLGVGINLLPHAVRELDELGLRDRIEAAGVACQELAYFTKRGERIWSEPRGLKAGYRWPQVSLHRGTLQQILFESACELIGADRIHLGKELVGFEAIDQEGVRVSFKHRLADGATVAFEGRTLIACDGIHSTARKVFYEHEGPPTWNGAVLWRGVAVADPFLTGRTMIMAGHTKTKFVCYPIKHDVNPAGQQLINFIAEMRFEKRELEEREDWNRLGSLDDFLPAFEGFRFDWLDVPALVRAAEAVWVYPMVDRDPLPRWTHGPVTLLGDAAHPMYPIGSNGASQAILDAATLTGCLASHRGDWELGLQRYEEARRPATGKIVMLNRKDGPEAVMQLVEDRAPDGFDNLHDVISPDELQEVADRYKKVAGFAVAELNSRASLSEPSLYAAVNS